MKKKLNLKNLHIKSFVTTTDQKIKGGTLPKGDDGTINNCHCPTYACNPSIERPTMCCL